MRTQACEPCAKRKVRCDREEPCSNCKRRKQDHCTYPEFSPADKVKKLEALVRALGGDPEDDASTVNQSRSSILSPAASLTRSVNESPRLATSIDSRSKDPLILEEDGQQYYLESRVWLTHGHREVGKRTANAKNPLLLRNAPDAFQSIISAGLVSNRVATSISQHDAQTLWSVFKQRVNPFIRISFSWDLKRLEDATVSTEYLMDLTDAENALVSSIYLASIVSLSDAECKTKFQQSRTSLLSEYQSLCEVALAKTNILCVSNIVALKAMTIYILASLDRLSTHSLWGLMGLAVRNAEKLGIHRDGTLLGLSPSETEERRRLWWQLQYQDLILAIRLGATPLTLMADWDVKLPLNIEDDELTPDMKTFPEERTGLTSMAYGLFTYYVLEKQRQYHVDKGKFELSWSTNQSVPRQTRETFIDELEDGLNKTFLQYCDPIKPLELLLQLISRALICVFRQRILMTAGEQPGQVSQEHRGPLLAASMQLLEYSISIHSHRLLKNFLWLSTNGFPWHAFMIVLVEVSHENDTEKRQQIWTLLSDLYAANTSLLELEEDRRRLHVAELVVAAWKTCQSKAPMEFQPQQPDFVTMLESRLADRVSKSTQKSSTQDGHDGNTGFVTGLETPQSTSIEQDANFLFDLEFEDIDWSFWNSID